LRARHLRTVPRAMLPALTAAAIAIALASCGGALDHVVRPVDPKAYLPATLRVEDPSPITDVRVVKVRVWVAPAAQLEDRWREHLIEELDQLAQLVEPLLALRLEFAAPQDWPIGALAASDVGSGMADLRQRDPGDAATPWVIGVVAPGGAPSRTMVDLVAAEPFSPHVVLRAYAAGPEAAALEPQLPRLSAGQRADVLGAHRRHKQAVVLLYALARTLGAIDEREPTRTQHPTYSPTQVGPSARNVALMRLTLEARLAGTDPTDLARDLLAAIDDQPWGGWLDGDRDARALLLRGVLDARLAEAVVGAVPAPALAQYQRAEAALRAGDDRGAEAELEPLLAAYPANATLRLLACRIDVARSGPALPMAPTCARVIDLAPADVSVHLLLGGAWAARGELQRAHDALDAAARVLAGRATPAALDEWLTIAHALQAMGAITWTEALLARPELRLQATAPAVAALSTWVRQQRVRYGAAAGAADPADEGALVASVKGVLDLVNTDKFKDAAVALAASEKRWPKAAGLATMRCELEFRQQRYPKARAACSQAIGLAPDTSWALYLLGVMELQGNAAARTAGIAHLRHAIAADPELGQAWRTLGKALARYGTADELAALRADYQTRFGRAL
jgi:tetratricopeptide (TPR) repeat protein